MKHFILTDELTLENLGRLIHQERKARHMTLDDLEMYTGITKKTLIKIEKGGDAKFSTVLAILQRLDLRMDLFDKKTCEENGKRVEIDDEWY